MMEKVDQYIKNFKVDSRDIKLLVFNMVAVFVMTVLSHLHLQAPHFVAALLSLNPFFK